jgi:hypothetical protein
VKSISRDRLRGAAGPLLIASAVAVVLRGFVFGRVSNQHPDLLAFWMPTYCHLGRSLASGHIPAWNPYVMGGAPFAADPQSGWMYLPAMALFTALPCDVAIRAMVVAQPILAGLGIYWFTRSEGLSRPAATTGGLVLALALCSSRLGLFLPFPESLAWTALLLAAASRYVRASTWDGRFLWTLLTAGAWGQLAASHAGHGLVLGTLTLVAYLGATSWRMVTGARWTGREVATTLGLLVPSLFLVNLAYLVPRLSYLPESSYGAGFSKVIQLDGRPAAWPLDLASSPGMYMGGASLLLSLAALWTRRHRPIVLGFAIFGAVTYLLSLNPVASRLARSLHGLPGLDFYAHYPGRFALGLILVLPVLAAFGMEAWLHEFSGRARVISVACGVLIWLVLPIGSGIPVGGMVLAALGMIAGAAALTLAVRRPGLAMLLPAVLAVELVANGLIGQLATGVKPGASAVDHVWFDPLLSPSVDPGAYLDPGPIARYLQSHEGGRYISLAPAVASHRGYLTRQQPRYWGLLANQRAMLFRLEDAQGYNPFQLDRYWTFVRAISPRPLDYNAAAFIDPPPVALDLLDIRWVVTSLAGAGSAGVAGIARGEEPPWVLEQLPGIAGRAEVVTSWTVVDPHRALSRVLDDGFEPSKSVVLEQDPGLGGSTAPTAPTASPGSATYAWMGAQRARVEVNTTSPALVLIRNVYERHWQAEVDGRAAPVLPADYLIQAIPVAAGHHVIDLRYDDPTIGYGLLGSMLAVAALLLACLLSRRRDAGSPAASSGVLDLSKDSDESTS